MTATKNKLEHLTDEQWAKVHDTRETWLARGMSTTPTDRASVEAAMTRLYAAKGHPRPLMVWGHSPMSAALMAGICKGLFGDQLRDQLGGQLGGQLGDQLGDQLRQIYWNTRCSGWDMAWYAYWSIPRDLGHITYTADLSTLLDDFVCVSYSATSWTPYNGVCFLSDHPTEIHMTGKYREARLHNPDGWTVHAWNGTRVPEWVITGPTPELIHAEPNAEIRRCALEKLGWDVYIQLAGLELGQAVDDPGNPGQQLRLSQPLDIFGTDEDELVRVLLAVNGTVERGGIRRRFGITTPAHISDPVEAAAWTYGWPVHTYRQLQRRT